MYRVIRNHSRKKGKNMTTLLDARMSHTNFDLLQTFADENEVYETHTRFSSYRELEHHVDYLLNVAEFIQDARSVEIYLSVLDSVRVITQSARKFAQSTCTL